MGFYSDLIQSDTFSGGTYYGQGDYLIGMVSGTSYVLNILALQRGSLPDITVAITGSPPVLTDSVFHWYTGYSRTLINQSLNAVTNPSTLDVTLVKTNQNLSGTVANFIAAGTFGMSSFTPQLAATAKGRVNQITETVLTTNVPHLWGIYMNNAYTPLPRAVTSVSVVTAVGTAIYDRVVCYPFMVSKPYLLVEVGMFFSATASSESVRFAIYDGSNGYMGTLLKDFGQVTPASTGYRGSLNILPLSAGTYYGCFWASTDAPNSNYVSGGLVGAVTYAPDTESIYGSFGFGHVHPAPVFDGAWPDPFTGATYPLTGTSSTNVQVPIMALRMSGLTSLYT